MSTLVISEVLSKDNRCLHARKVLRPPGIRIYGLLNHPVSTMYHTPNKTHPSQCIPNSEPNCKKRTNQVVRAENCGIAGTPAPNTHTSRSYALTAVPQASQASTRCRQSCVCFPRSLRKTVLSQPSSGHATCTYIQESRKWTSSN